MSETPLARIAGPIAIVAGISVLVTRFVIMLTIPAALGDPLKTAVLSPIYTVNSVGSIAAFGLLAIALAAIYEREARSAGSLGLIGFGAAMIGTVFMAGDWWYEAFAVPWMADIAPTVFETGAAGRLLAGGLLSFALFALGWALFGAASLRAGVFPRATSVTILIAGIGAGIPIAGAYLYASLVFGGAIAWLGVWLMRSSSAHASRLGAAAAI